MSVCIWPLDTGGVHMKLGKQKGVFAWFLHLETENKSLPNPSAQRGVIEPPQYKTSVFFFTYPDPPPAGLKGVSRTYGELIQQNVFIITQGFLGLRE